MFVIYMQRKMKHKLILDEYKKCWVRSYYEVEANSRKTAVFYLLNNDPDHCTKTGDTRFHPEMLLPSENNDEPTCKIIADDNKVVWDNTSAYNRYARVSMDVVQTLSEDAKGFEEHVFRVSPLNNTDKDMYFVDEEWANEQGILLT